MEVWQITAIYSVIFFTFLFNASQYVTQRFSVTYRSLARKEKSDWDCRYSSSLHAVVTTVLVIYVVCFADTFREDNGDKTPLVLRRSFATDVTLGLSMGYFITDIFLVAAYYPGGTIRRRPHESLFLFRVGCAMGGPAMLAHHIAAFLSVFAAAQQRRAHLYTLLLLATEVTTPFLNLRWWLDTMGKRLSPEYTANGIALNVAWFLGRVILFPWFFRHEWQHRHEIVEHLSGLPLLLIMVVPPLLFCLNLFWFMKLIKGTIRHFARRRKIARGEQAKIEPSVVKGPSRFSVGGQGNID